ncbi:unnamed protein product [Urochloa decumbens]|uniref:Uncharacterized protein n=1 Tax=Urochloa decumbens TaxID=240449 RepID=A0ABC8W562_9POAL
MPQKESTKPSRQLRHASGTQRARSGRKPRRTSSNHGNTTTAKDNKKESTANVSVSRAEEMRRNVQEVELAIQQLNELGLGYDISYEFEGYLQLLPCGPPRIDTSLQPDYEQLNELQIRDILYRIKYCKFIRQRRKNNEMNLEDDHPLYLLEEKLECLEEDVTKMEGDQLLEYLHKEGLLRQIENNDIFDWSFLYLTVAGLDDYQRLVPQNYGGYEYDDWDTYREYFHSYEIELEYLRYWKELLKELKWMEDYVLMERPSLKWGKICTRGCYQAIKIASHFSVITESLARGAYYDCIDAMCLDIIWYKELDGVYFEIWQRIRTIFRLNNDKESFKEALNQVYKSEKFPLRHHVMKDALDNDCSEMEKEFCTCTASISPEVTEDKGREFIAYAIRNQRGRPKFYAQYIEKKIEVAKALGVIPTVVIC